MQECKPPMSYTTPFPFCRFGGAPIRAVLDSPGLKPVRDQDSRTRDPLRGSPTTTWSRGGMLCGLRYYHVSPLPPEEAGHSTRRQLTTPWLLGWAHACSEQLIFLGVPLRTRCTTRVSNSELLLVLREASSFGLFAELGFQLDLRGRTAHLSQVLRV